MEKFVLLFGALAIIECGQSFRMPPIPQPHKYQHLEPFNNLDTICNTKCALLQKDILGIVQALIEDLDDKYIPRKFCNLPTISTMKKYRPNLKLIFQV